MAGPLSGLRIVEMAGIGPAPFAAMMLADHGAEVIRVERAGMMGIPNDPLARSRKSIALDLRRDEAREAVRRLAAAADGLVEGYRPGVMERLDLGPGRLLKDNPKVVYGRVTGWGQQGPLAATAGHDLNYLALTGLLHGIGPRDRPVVPINYLADYAGGGMMLAFGMVAALLHVRGGGEGQVIDAAMTEGAALIGALTFGMRAAGLWQDERESNLLDGGSPFYRVYSCSDGKFLAVAALEPQFRAVLLERLGLPSDSSGEDIQAVIAGRPRDAWVALCAGSDACVAPVLGPDEAIDHPHNVARGTFLSLDGVAQPGPAPRYSRTGCAEPEPPRPEGADGEDVLLGLGYSSQEIAALRATGALL